jgi:hypothetical protein
MEFNLEKYPNCQECKYGERSLVSQTGCSLDIGLRSSYCPKDLWKLGFKKELREKNKQLEDYVNVHKEDDIFPLLTEWSKGYLKRGEEILGETS